MVRKNVIPLPMFRENQMLLTLLLRIDCIRRCATISSRFKTAVFLFAFNRFVWWRGYSGRSIHFKIVLGSNPVADLHFCEYAFKTYLEKWRDGEFGGPKLNYPASRRSRVYRPSFYPDKILCENTCSKENMEKLHSAVGINAGFLFIWVRIPNL